MGRAEEEDHGKVIWWAELGIRGKSDPPRDCLDVLQKLESRFPELAGFVFWSDRVTTTWSGTTTAASSWPHPRRSSWNESGFKTTSMAAADEALQAVSIRNHGVAEATIESDIVSPEFARV